MASTANVDVLIDAFTEAAEDAIGDVGEELLGLVDDGQIAQSTLDEVGDELNDAAASAGLTGEMFDDLSGDTGQLAFLMALLDSRADEAGDSLLGTSLKATTTQGAFSGLTVGTSGLNFAFMGLGTTIWAVLLPALAALLTTIAPIVALLGGAATAAAAFVGVTAGFMATGIVTHLTKLKNELAAAGDEVRELIQPMGALASSVLVTLIRRIPKMVREILDAAGGMQQMAWWIEELGITIMELIPGLVGFAVTLAQDVAPAVMKIIRFLQGTGPGLVNSFFSTFERLEPELRSFGKAILNMLPTLLDFGTNVLSLLLPALTKLTKAGTKLMKRVDWNSVKSGMGQVGSAIDTIAPKFNDFMGEVVQLIPPLLKLASESLPFVAKATRQLFAVLAGLIGVVNDVIDVIGMDGLRVVVIALAGALAVLGGPFSMIIGAAIIAANAVPLVTKAFRGLMDVLDGVGDKIGQAFRAGVRTATRLLNELNEGVADTVNGFIENFNDMIEVANQNIPGLNLDTMGKVNPVEVETGLKNPMGIGDPQGASGFYGDTGGNNQQGPSGFFGDAAAGGPGDGTTNVRLKVDGDDELANVIRDNIEAEEDNRRAREDRYQRRQNLGKFRSVR